MLLAGRLARISLDLISFWPGRRRLREAAVAPRVERNPRRALHNTYFMRDTARESTGDKNKKRSRASVHSIPFPKIECTRCYFALWKSRNLGILSSKLFFHPEKKRNRCKSRLDINSREERKGVPLFPIRHVSRSMRNTSEEGERFFNVSGTGSDTRTLETTRKGNDDALVPFFFEEHSRRSQDGVVHKRERRRRRKEGRLIPVRLLTKSEKA